MEKKSEKKKDKEKKNEKTNDKKEEKKEEKQENKTANKEENKGKESNSMTPPDVSKMQNDVSKEKSTMKSQSQGMQIGGVQSTNANKNISANVSAGGVSQSQGMARSF